MADREYHIAVNHRSTGDVVKLGQRGDVAGLCQHVVPFGASVVHANGVQLAGGVGNDDGVAGNSSAGASQDASRFRNSLVVPKHVSVDLGQCHEVIVFRGHKYASTACHGRIDDWNSQ